MYAVVTTGGKQYRVEAGSELIVERLGADAGASITFDRVLLVGDGDAITVGTPTVSGATVSATVLGEALGPKLAVFKFKQKVKYRRMAGHRQHLVRVRIDEISASGRTSSADQKAEAAPAKPKRTRAAKAEAAAADDAPARAPQPTESTEADAKPKRARKPAAKADTAAAADAKPKRTRKPASAKASDTTDTTEAEE
jgi:large subunit ribosomal protein L21